MSQKIGLEIYDAAGNKIFDSDNATTEAIGRGQTGQAAGSLTDANIQNRKVWVSTTRVLSSGFVGQTFDSPFRWRPAFTVSGNRISWTFKCIIPNGQAGVTATPPNFEFIYGVFS